MSKKKQSREPAKAREESEAAATAEEALEIPQPADSQTDGTEAVTENGEQTGAAAAGEAASGPEDSSAVQTDEAGELVQALERERDQYKDALIRERADFENYKKRNASLSAASYANGTEAAIAAVLPVMDNFERALAAECSDKPYADGMQMIMRQLQGALESLGVSEVATAGTFDPAYHHAVMQVEDADLDSGQIAETLQKGYMLKDKVIRPAMVKVNK